MGKVGAAVAFMLLAVVVVPYGTSSVNAASTVSVSGVVYWDRDNDGVHDVGEPGVAGLAVHWSGGNGTPATVTSAAGSYTLAGLTAGGSGKVLVETGWFRFTGFVPAWMNNFAGIGATDTNPAPAVFPDARTGVRAQIQHLRAYGDPGAYACAVPPLSNPCVDPRFDLVAPKGKALTWNQLGNGNWATASTYATTILTLYQEALAFSGATSLTD